MGRMKRGKILGLVNGVCFIPIICLGGSGGDIKHNYMDVNRFDFNAFSDQLVVAWKYAKNYSYSCCCPGCGKTAIKSHLLQKHPILASISDEKHCVVQMVDNRKDPRSGDWDFYQRHNVGISDALQYKLFCKEHDNGLYKDLEQRNSIPESKRDCLLLAFRSACAVRHQEEHRLHIYEKTRTDSEIDMVKEGVSSAFIRRMDAVVDNLWSAINGNGDNHYLFRMIAMPRIDIAASDCMTDEADLEAHIMDDNYYAPLNCLFINLIPDGDKLLLLLGCDTRYDKEGEFKSIIMGFPTGDVPSDYHFVTVKGILLKCSNWCCAPKLYNDSDWKVFLDEYDGVKVENSCRA